MPFATRKSFYHVSAYWSHEKRDTAIGFVSFCLSFRPSSTFYHNAGIVLKRFSQSDSPERPVAVGLYVQMRLVRCLFAADAIPCANNYTLPCDL